jgi:hypothetical protein
VGTYCALLVTFIFAVIASAQEPSGPSIPSPPTYKLEGRVVTPSGEWIQTHAPEIVDPTQKGSFGEKVLFTAHSVGGQRQGFAFWPLPAGTYTVRVSGINQQHEFISTTHKVVVVHDVTDVELALLPGSSVPVTVRKEHPRGPCWWNPLAEKVHSSNCSGLRAATLELVPVGSLRAPYLSAPGVIEDPSHFTMHGIEPGKYVVRVELPVFPDNYVQSVRSGNLDLLHDKLDVPDYESVLPIEILVRDDFANIQVHASGAARQPSIVILREDVLLPKPQILRCNEAKFICSVAPGSYAVFAFEGTLRDYLDPEFLPKYAGRAIHVTLSASQTKTVDVDVIHIEN